MIPWNEERALWRRLLALRRAGFELEDDRRIALAYSRGELAVSVIPELARPARLVEIDIGDVEDRGAPDLVFPVEVIHVALRVGLDLAVGQLDQLVALEPGLGLDDGLAHGQAHLAQVLERADVVLGP